jgi:hypothetical protein
MQALATATEKPPAQQQWETMEKNNAQNNRNRRTSGRVFTSGVSD